MRGCFLSLLLAVHSQQGFAWMLSGPTVRVGCRGLARCAVTDSDRDHMQSALTLARRAGQWTFPNPAVGCVLVREGAVIGQGWHPRAGWPHAEIYALADVNGLLPMASRSPQPGVTTAADDELLAEYLVKAGALFTGAAERATAYVTLEPCSHEGKRTPPCTRALLAAGVSRLVIGSVDPNPCVDGGGLSFLADQGLTIDVMDGPEAIDAGQLIRDFAARITAPPFDPAVVTGAQKAVIRREANRRKAAQSLTELTVSTKRLAVRDSDDTEAATAPIVSPPWLTQADAMLRKHELLLLRCQVKKKAIAKAIGEDLGKQLNALVAHVVGHTVLLYRPSNPPRILDADAGGAVDGEG